MLAYVRLRRHKDAVTLIDKMLAHNPNDNQGSRYLLRSEVLRGGDKERAVNIFDEYADDYPPYCYEVALTGLKLQQRFDTDSLQTVILPKCFAEILTRHR